LRSFLSNLGNDVFLVETLLVNVPTLWVTPLTSMIEYWNVLSSEIAVTVNVPLYPISFVPALFVVLVTLRMMTWSFTFKLCGSSATTVTVLVETEQVPINLGFLLYA